MTKKNKKLSGKKMEKASGGFNIKDAAKKAALGAAAVGAGAASMLLYNKRLNNKVDKDMRDAITLNNNRENEYTPTYQQVKL